MATHSSTLALKIPWMEEPGVLQTMGSQRVGYDWMTSLSLWRLYRILVYISKTCPRWLNIRCLIWFLHSCEVTVPPEWTEVITGVLFTIIVWGFTVKPSDLCVCRKFRKSNLSASVNLCLSITEYYMRHYSFFFN